jgi:hypothetical protein
MQALHWREAVADWGVVIIIEEMAQRHHTQQPAA